MALFLSVLLHVALFGTLVVSSYFQEEESVSSVAAQRSTKADFSEQNQEAKATGKSVERASVIKSVQIHRQNLLIKGAKMYLQRWQALNDEDPNAANLIENKLNQLLKQMDDEFSFLASDNIHKDNIYKIDEFKTWLPIVAEFYFIDQFSDPRVVTQYYGELQKLNEYLDQVDRQFKRMYLPTGQPLWLDQLNYRRRALHDYFFKNYESQQTSLVTSLIDKQMNATSATLNYIFLFNLRQWLKDIPQAQLGLRVYSDYIEPVLIVSTAQPKSEIVLDLYTGDSNYLGKDSGNIYSPEYIILTFLKYFNEHGDWQSGLFKLHNSQFEATNSLATSVFGQWWNDFFAAPPEVDNIFLGSLNAFFPEPYIYFKDKPQKGELVFKELSLNPQQNESSSDVTKNEVNDSETIEKVNDNIETAMEQFLSEQDVADKTSSLQALLDMATELAVDDNNSDMVEKLKNIDSALYEKYLNNPSELTVEELQQLAQMSKAMEMLLERASSSQESPDFIANPIARVANDFELKNEFNSYLPFLSRLPNIEEIKARKSKSSVFHKVKKGFDFKILQPERDIVFRTQREVDVFNNLKYREKLFKLIDYTNDAITDLNAHRTLDKVLQLVHYFVDANSSATFEVNNQQWQVVYENLSVYIRLINNLNDVIEFVFQKSVSLQSSSLVNAPQYYFVDDLSLKLIEKVVDMTHQVYKSPSEFLNKINKHSYRKEILNSFMMIRNLSHLANKVFKSPPNAQFKQKFTQTWQEITDFWLNG
ncbi:MAG: hypothetical protein KDD40_03310, partial [Bdellovibrionales bacterium]|nr:hypothetical protein [Bdellovibrionales bacterium]